MRLRLLNPGHRLSVDTLSTARKLRVVEAIDLGSGRSPALVVVANGSPDNRVLLVLAHTLDGLSTVDVTFPSRKHVTVFSWLQDYALMRYAKMLVLIDQEDKPLEEIHEALRARAPVRGRAQGRLATLTLETRLGTSTVIVAVNGTDDPRFTRHTIEDHLMALAEKLRLLDLPATSADPKEVWRGMSKEAQHEVLRQLLTSPELAEEAFPQQVRALRELALE